MPIDPAMLADYQRKCDRAVEAGYRLRKAAGLWGPDYWHRGSEGLEGARIAPTGGGETAAGSFTRALGGDPDAEAVGRSIV